MCVQELEATRRLVKETGEVAADACLNALAASLSELRRDLTDHASNHVGELFKVSGKIGGERLDILARDAKRLKEQVSCPFQRS